MNILIKSEDIERVVGQMSENTSVARSYFGSSQMKNSTHISSAEIKKEYGNIPVIVRGDTGVVPKHGLDVTDIVPMPIEIDDTITAVALDDYERATAMGKQQIIDEYLNQHAEMIRETTNALCAQAHRGKIDYMMKGATGLVRYQVDYGQVAEINSPLNIEQASYGEIVLFLTQLKSEIKVGGAVEFIASTYIYGKLLDILANAHRTDAIKSDSLLLGPFVVKEDMDSYKDVQPDGNVKLKSICEKYEICCRALNAGQKLKYLRLDDVIQRNAVPIYSFTEKADGQRGMKLYTKSKPFPLINLKGIVFGSFTPRTINKVTGLKVAATQTNGQLKIDWVNGNETDVDLVLINYRKSSEGGDASKNITVESKSGQAGTHTIDSLDGVEYTVTVKHMKAKGEPKPIYSDGEVAKGTPKSGG